MKIYIDVIFLVNLIMDAMVIWLVSVLDRRKIKKLRILEGAAVGSFLYCVIFLFPYGGKALNLIYGAVALGISLQISFRVKSLKTFIRLMVIGLMASVLMGGVFIAVFYLSNAGYIAELAVGSIKFSYVILLTLIFYIAIRWCGGVFYGVTTKQKDYCRIKIYFEGSEAEIIALKDTGNFLIDDGYGNKIIIGEFAAVRNLFSAENQLLYLKKLEPVEIISQLSGSVKEKVSLVPFSSLGAERGFLTAYKTDGAELCDEKTIFIENILLLVYNGKLSSNKSCNGIINPIIMET